MTTTKVIYVLAIIMPFGLMALAAFFLAKKLWERHKAQEAALAAAH